MVTATSGVSNLTRRLEAYATLVRVPNLFTAPPDVLLGAALAVGAGTAASTAASPSPAASTFATASPLAVAAACLASMLLYAGGTTLNDYFDAPIDAEERPERPIPAGRVDRRSTLFLGATLLVAGVIVAWSAALRAGIVAALLALDVVLYDAWLKDGTTGFLAMGAARGLDVLLGAAVLVDPFSLPAWALAVPAVVVAYVAAVTFMAAEEATDPARGRVGVAAVAAAVAAGAAPTALFVAGAGTGRIAAGAAIAAVFLAWVSRPLAGAFDEPTPGTVGPAVGACVTGIVVLDAAFAAVAGVRWSLLALAFLLPTVGLARAFDVS